jgi:hypothetical protein
MLGVKWARNPDPAQQSPKHGAEHQESSQHGQVPFCVGQGIGSTDSATATVHPGVMTGLPVVMTGLPVVMTAVVGKPPRRTAMIQA